MLGLNVAFNLPRIHNKVKKTLRLIILRQMRNAARKFVLAAIKRIPKDTGMARGTFLNLKQILGPIPSNSYFVGGREGLFYYDRGLKLPKTPESGALLATPPNEIFTEKDGIFYFNYENSVLHYRINEFYKVIGKNVRGAPWQSFEAGRQAFINYMNEFLPKRLPKIKNFLIITQIRIAGGQIRQTVHDISRDEPIED